MHRIAVIGLVSLCYAGLAGAQQPPSEPPMAQPPAAGMKAGSVKCLPSGKCDAARIHFGFNSAAIDTVDIATLDHTAACLRANSNLRATIEGSTDERGSLKYNRKLAQRRADAVATFFEAHGVPSTQIGTVALGKERPLCASHTETCWAQNRNASIAASAPVASAEVTVR